MAHDWRELQWGEIATLEYGKRLRGYENAPGPYRVFGTNGPIGLHIEPLCPHPTVIVGRKGAYRGIHYSPKPCYVIDTAFYLKPKVKIDIRWAYYQLLTHDINSMDSGSAIPSTSRESFYNLPVKVPPMDEQRAIAHILGTLDDKIELNRRMNETLEGMARAIFKSWFVDFDPVRAKADGRHPVGMDAETARLFPDSFEDSELGKIPKGWRVIKASELFLLEHESINPSKFTAEIFDHYSIPAFDNGRMPRPESGDQIKSNKLLVPAQAVLISKLNPRIPRIWLPRISTLRRSVCSTEFLVALPIQPATREYIYTLFSSTTFIGEFATMVTGTSGSHQRVKPEYLLNMELIFPYQELVARFTYITKPLFIKVASNIKQTRTLAAIRYSLLPKLLSGQIRVKDAEKFLEAIP